MLASRRNHYQARSSQLQSQGKKANLEKIFRPTLVERGKSNI